MDLPNDVSIQLDPTFIENDLLRDVWNYWNLKRGSRLMPSRRDINPAEFKSQVAHVLLVDVLSNAQDFRYRLIGSKLARHFPTDVTGMTFRAALASYGDASIAATVQVYRTVALGRAAAHIKGPGGWFGQESKVFEAILLPLSDDGKHANMIFGAFYFDWSPLV